MFTRIRIMFTRIRSLALKENRKIDEIKDNVNEDKDNFGIVVANDINN